MAVTINASTTAGLVQTADTSGVLALQTAGTTAVTVDASQNVGIGTTPTYKLQVSPGTYSDQLAVFNEAGTWTANGGVVIADYYNATTLIGGIKVSAASATSGYLSFHTGGTTERMRIDSSGRVTTPFQPCFSASSSASITAPNPWITWTASVNIGSHFNATTGVFTAPIAGTYLFSAQGLANGTSSLEVFPRKNSTQIGAGTAIRVANGGNSGIGTTVFYLTLAANDTVDLYVTQGPTNTNANFQGFTGQLVI